MTSPDTESDFRAHLAVYGCTMSFDDWKSLGEDCDKIIGRLRANRKERVMGAIFEAVEITAKHQKEARAKATAIQKDLQQEYGHGAYGGHLGTIEGVNIITVHTFQSVEDAESHAQDNHQKWESPYLMKAGPETYVLAGWMPS